MTWDEMENELRQKYPETWAEVDRLVNEIGGGGSKMTDERFSFVEDVKTRKNIARSAAHKVSGAKSKKCNFPSDYLSRKEKLALNGDCQSWDLSKFYTCDEFVQMPMDVQIEYINRMTETYKIGTRAISSILFQKNPYYLDNYARYHGINFKSHGVSGHNGKKYNIAFTEAINSAEKKEIKETADAIHEELKAPEAKVEAVTFEEPKKQRNLMERVELVMNNGIDYKLLNDIFKLFNGKCKFTIIVEEAE